MTPRPRNAPDIIDTFQLASDWGYSLDAACLGCGYKSEVRPPEAWANLLGGMHLNFDDRTTRQRLVCSKCGARKAFLRLHRV